MASRGKDKLRSLLRKTERRAARIRTAQKAAREHLQAEILNPANSRTGQSRTRLYREIARTYGAVGRVIEDEVYGICGDADEAVFTESAGDIVPVAPDARRVKDLYEFICPANGDNLAAVYTRNMTDAAISKLRNALIEVSRQAAIEGKTAREIQTMLKQKWAELAGDEDNFRFVDRAGRRWNNDTYVQMLTRTTAQRAYNEAALNRYADMGCHYTRIASFGVPDCDICKEWNERVVRITEDGDGSLPTVEDARNAGVFHPNCLCFFAFVDDDEVEAEVAGVNGTGPFADSSITGQIDNPSTPQDILDDTRAKMKSLRLLGTRFKKPQTFGELLNANPKYKEDVVWQENCQRCVVAYEARCRGYGVVAQQARGDGLGRVTGFGERLFENPSISRLHVESAGTPYRESAEAKMREYGDGARAIIWAQWTDLMADGIFPASGAHVICLRNIGGKIYWVDPQSGDAESQFLKPMHNRFYTLVNMCRVDDLKFNEKHSVLARCIQRPGTD